MADTFTAENLRRAYGPRIASKIAFLAPPATAGG
jgi:hypothetical protein